MIFSLLEVDRHMHLYRDVKTASLQAFSTFRVSSDMSRNPLIHTVLSEVDWWASRQTMRSYTDRQTDRLTDKSTDSHSVPHRLKTERETKKYTFKVTERKNYSSNYNSFL